MRRNFFCLLTLLFLAMGGKAQILFQFSKDTVTTWNYEFGDEFEEGYVNLDKWFPSFPWGRPLYSQDVIYVMENIKFRDGNAVFLIDKNDSLYKLDPWEVDSNYLRQNGIPFNKESRYGFKYTGGLVWSKKNFKYGYFEIKFKAAKGQGIWPAFWLFGGKPNYEIDFFELKGEKKRSLHVDVHCPDKCVNFKEGPFGYRKSWGHWLDTKYNLADSFNVVSGEWTDKYIKYYLNGELIAYYNVGFDVPMELTLGTGIAKDGKAFKPGPNAETVFPNEFTVDYVRVWQAAGPAGAGAPQPGAQTISTGKKISTNTKASSKLKYFNSEKKKTQDQVTISVLPLKGKKALVTLLGNRKTNSEITFSEGPVIVRSQVLTWGENVIDLANASANTLSFTLKSNGRQITRSMHVE